MPSVDETSLGRNQLSSTLIEGLETLDLNQLVKFTQFVRVVLPLDGFVFWVKASILTQPHMKKYIPKYASDIDPANIEIEVPGSLHMTTIAVQSEDENYAQQRIVFTSEYNVQAFSCVGPHYIYIGEFEGDKFAFSRRESFYRQADLHHYIGDVLNTPLLDLLIEDEKDFNTSELFVSNSLPFWLSMQYPDPCPLLEGLPYPIFPSYLLPQNEQPPYIVVHNVPQTVIGLQMAPAIENVHNIIGENALFGLSESGEPIQSEGMDGGQSYVAWPQVCMSSLVRETVRVSLYGLNHRDAMNFLRYVMWFIDVHEYFGLLNSPVIVDEKRPQPELGIIATKKTITFEINYSQATVLDFTQQFIKSVQVDYVLLPDGNLSGIPSNKLLSEKYNPLTGESQESLVTE
jgi:hypothetical protein